MPNKEKTLPVLFKWHLTKNSIEKRTSVSINNFGKVNTLIYRIIVQQNFILFLEFSNLHGLIPSYTFIRFWKNYLPTRLFNHRLLLWNLRVGRLFFHPTRSYSILHVYCFSQKFPSYTFIPSCTIIQ